MSRALPVLTALVLFLAGGQTAQAAEPRDLLAGVVRIDSTIGDTPRIGSGFVVRIDVDSAYVATAAHVVEGDANPSLFFRSQPHVARTAKVLAQEGGDPNGLALLLVEGGVPADVMSLPMSAGRGEDLQEGSAVTALGIPATIRNWAVLPGTVISWKNRMILFSGGVDQGNSGGPLLAGSAVAGVVMRGTQYGEAVLASSLKIFLQSNRVAWATGAGTPGPDTRPAGTRLAEAEPADQVRAQAPAARSPSDMETAARPAKLTVRSNVTGDTVFVDGERHGPTRLDLELPPGSHVVRVEKEGYEPFEERVELAAGAEKTVRATLQRPGPKQSPTRSAPVSEPTANLDPRDASLTADPLGPGCENLTPDQQTMAGNVSDPKQLAMLCAQFRMQNMAEKTVLAKLQRPGPKPGESFRDCPSCPEMVVIPAGSFQMGSPAGEEGRADDEGPVHSVQIAQPFALGRREVTVGEFKAFVEATGYRTEAEKDGGCHVLNGQSGAKDPKRDWRAPGFTQGDDHPVVCVSWNDARAYLKWLSTESGQTYRLPNEAEWEHAARAGTTTARFWGESADQACAYENVADKSLKAKYPDHKRPIHACDDGRVHAASVGSFKPNAFGLFDILGNVWEWTEDCWNDSYKGAPSDGSTWAKGDCELRVLRGGCWASEPGYVRSAYRIRSDAGARYSYAGFRPARTF